ncbi:sugar transferase [Pilimelia anulata]|uniref:Sugar transferase n=1 Tax=Pilimelia anulata TaxID=53371 RepID=A0A8J3F8M7_9ACTN|nr:HAD family hydrolase [Pilimelia anulata]GGJ88368.1 sugar transferase [Pilimelia anulata]
MSIQPSLDLVIFDCDGVLVDSEPIVLGVMAERMRRLGIAITDAECARDFAGLTQNATADLIAGRLGAPVARRWFDDLTLAVDRALAERVQPVPGITAVLDRLTIPYCAASNGRPEKVALTLAATGLAGYFHGRVFTSAQVSRGKPAPDLFLLAAKSMLVAPERCVVIEDSETGVSAARAAGMRVLRYETGAPGHGADGGFSRMEDLPKLLGLPTP